MVNTVVVWGALGANPQVRKKTMLMNTADELLREIPKSPYPVPVHLPFCFTNLPGVLEPSIRHMSDLSRKELEGVQGP